MKYINEDTSITYTGDLDTNKKEALERIALEAIDIGKTNSFMCSLGFQVDNRWIEKNDIDNATCVIEAWFTTGAQDVYYRDAYNVTHVLTEAQLRQLKLEAQLNRMYMLSLKWRREELIIQVATTVEQVWDMVEMTNAQVDALIPFIPS
jgi:hypothetical protein